MFCVFVGSVWKDTCDTRVLVYTCKYAVEVNPPTTHERDSESCWWGREERGEGGGQGAAQWGYKRTREREGESSIEKGAIIPPSATTGGALCPTSARARAPLQNNISEHSELVVERTSTVRHDSHRVDYPVSLVRACSLTRSLVRLYAHSCLSSPPCWQLDILRTNNKFRLDTASRTTGRSRQPPPDCASHCSAHRITSVL